MLTAVLLATAVTMLSPTEEIRYCGPPPRDANGVIIRRTDVPRAFRRIHACPSTGRFSGACPNWSMDHVWPLACGGCDAVWNMQWLPNSLKSARQIASPGPKDRWEREIYDYESCHFQVQQ